MHTAATFAVGLYAATFAIVLDLLTEDAWPSSLRLLGAVHVRSTIESAVNAAASLRHCDVVASFSASSVRRVARGCEADIDVVVRTHASSAILWRCTSTLLFFKRASKNLSAAPFAPTAPNIVPRNTVKEALFTHAAMPAAWAAASGDINPIHTSNWTAKLLGFHRGAVAHGMSVVFAAAPRVLDALTRTGIAQQETASGNAPLQLRVQFMRPVFLSARLHLSFIVTPTDVATPCAEFSVVEQLSTGDKVLVSGSMNWGVPMK